MKIVLWGGFGMLNLGDDLILYSTIKDLKEINENFEIAYFCARKSENICMLIEEFSDIEVFHDDIFSKIKCFSRNYNLIIPGGQVIDDENKFFPLGYLMIDCLIYNFFMREKVLLFSVGIRPLTKRLHFLYLKILFRYVKYLGLRDRLGMKWIHSVYPSITQEFVLDSVLGNIELYGDSIFTPSITTYSVLFVQGNEKRRHSQSDLISHLQDKVRDGYCEKISVLQHDIRYDLSNTEVSKLLSVRTNEICYPKSISQVKKIYCEHDLVFTNRLHSAILGLVSGSAVCFDGNHKKLKALFHMDINLKTWIVSGLTLYYLSIDGIKELIKLKKLRMIYLKEVLKS